MVASGASGGSMNPQRWMLVVCFSLASVFGTGESVTTAETQTYTCTTFGSGVVQPFNGSAFYVHSNCPFIFTRFTHNRVKCDVTVRRGDNGLLVQVEIIINKVRTVLQNGSILVEKKSVSLPYDHTYQHIFHYGLYTRLRSSLLPLSVTWHDVPGGIDSLRVDLEQELNTDMMGLCGKHGASGNKQQLISESVLSEDTCQIRDPIFTVNQECREFFSYTLDCLQARTPFYMQLCEENIYGYELNEHIVCAFFKEIVLQCGNNSYAWNIWRYVTRCAEPTCPGDLVYVEQGAAFIPSCSNPNPRFSNQDMTSSCVCPKGEVLNDHLDGFQCVVESSCPCVFAGRSYLTGDIRSTKCQSCVCDGGRWLCSENFCPPRCLIEGQFVTTFDGKQYAVPGKCAYVALQDLDWTIKIEFSEKEASLKAVTLQLYQETFTFEHNMVKTGDEEITELHQSDHVLVFWQSSMYVQIYTSFGLKIQVQVSPEIQIYITSPKNHTGIMSGLCGNSNNDTTDDFTTSSGIIENSAQPFALSWSLGSCAVNIPNSCINTDNEIFADDKCSVLNNPAGIFAKCHGHIPPEQYHTACVQRTCNCGGNLQQCLCVSLGSYAKACRSLGVELGDWRKSTNCTLKCQKNQEFFYDIRACNRTCRSLSGRDPRCGLEDAPVEGCGCPEGTHLNQGTCTPKSECSCHHHGGTTPPGPVVMDGRQCLCEDGQLHCSKDCGCRNGKVCVHCSEYLVNTAQKTCDSLSKPLGTNTTCESGCYCPHDQYEDHHGNCVSRDNCTCVYSGQVFSAGQHVKTNCKTCFCGSGQWHCKDEPCPGTCQVYGNGHYQTFDSKWYRFDGHCQYTLVEDYCADGNGSFSLRVESVPCCDEALTCSRSIILDLQGEVTLTLSDMMVTKRLKKAWTLQEDPLYTTHTVGLYIIISVPSRGLTLIWDKHTRITVELHADWRNKVCGLCGNFDSSEMNDLQISGSAVGSSPLAFGNSWKSATPPCSDVTTEIFPCERNSYCSAWAQRRCMILTGNTFKDCHLKVDPDPYYHACVQESCSCEFEGKFLGFCTAVAAYAEACSNQEVCINWRTPDLCPVYCDYYNEQHQCSWHYEACGKMLTCGKVNYFTHKLEGCYPRCPKEAPYYDENTAECTTLRNCTCNFNDTAVQSGTVVIINSMECPCENGTITCPPPPTTIPTTILTTSTVKTTTSETTQLSTTTTPLTTTTSVSTTTKNWPTTTTIAPTTASTMATTTSPPTTPTTSATTTTAPTTTTSTVSTTTSTPATTTETSPSTTSTPTTTTTSTTTTTAPTTTSTVSTTTSTPATTIETSPSTTSTPSSTTTATAPTTTTSTVSTTTSTPATTTITTTSETSPPTTSTTKTTVSSTTTETPSTMATTTSTPTTATTSTTPETSATMSTTVSTPRTSATTIETSSAMPTSTPTTTSTSTTTEIWSTIVTSTSTPKTTTTSTTPETSSTMPTSTSTLLTTIMDISTTENLPTELSTITTTPITTSTVTPVAPTEASTTTASTKLPTTSTTTGPSTTPSKTTVVSTQLTTITDGTEYTTEQTTTAPTSEAPSTYTLITETFTTKKQIEPTATTLQSTTPFATSTTPVVTSGLTEVPTTEASTYISTSPTTPPECNCTDLKRKQSWASGDSWTEDCFHKICTNGKLEMTPVVCPETTTPTCPRGRATKVSDGCCETWKCDCRCEVYGDPHYITFQGLNYDFLDECTYTLVEEQSPRHHLTIVVDNFYCVPGLQGSCAKGITLTYNNNIATLRIIPHLFTVQATLNNVTIQPPYEEHGLKFETTGYIMSVNLPELRSFISLSPSYTLVINLAMEHFLNNTQGQCGVCGGPSCIRKGGKIEDDSCCDKTAYDWVYPDPKKPACFSAPRDVPCHHGPTPTPPPTFCPPNPLCELLHHPVFENCSKYVDLNVKKKNCEFDSCSGSDSSCSSLEQAAEECKKAGFCINWRRLTNGSCDVKCREGLVYRECSDKLDDFCHGGVPYKGASLEEKSSGCFCPRGLLRPGNHSNMCVSECPCCKGPVGEPKWPGDVWQSGCNLCTCNNRTRREECYFKPPKLRCGPSDVLINTSCCGDQMCVETICKYSGKTYKVGDRWKDAAHPCMSFSCSKEGVEMETKVCPRENCSEEDRIWDNQRCCFTCNQSCSPKVSNFSVTIENCTAVVQIPVCRGQCESKSRLVLHGDLQVQQEDRCCQENSSERRSVTLHCSDQTTRQHTYRHITGCECRAPIIWR
ncbi:mucin-19-like isoform X1 [Amphiprion ocellaris]|uniref:mucin-19-like isoform X1 n=1 Tax=Amphiprion ocellaris TaxID=80972 RepID=UPI0024112922|nr:mucin-19-like isoform X1 [Amphiprion ocellaris]